MDTCKGVSALKIEELEMSAENIKERSSSALLKRWKRSADNSLSQKQLRRFIFIEKRQHQKFLSGCNNKAKTCNCV
jgi:hypothetical protein